MLRVCCTGNVYMKRDFDSTSFVSRRAIVLEMDYQTSYRPRFLMYLTGNGGSLCRERVNYCPFPDPV